jgi:hypothetical protein
MDLGIQGIHEVFEEYDGEVRIDAAQSIEPCAPGFGDHGGTT